MQSGLFDGTSTYLIQNNNNKIICQYGFYNATTSGGKGYNHISFKDWIITKSNSATVGIFLITNIIALF